MRTSDGVAARFDYQTSAPYLPEALYFGRTSHASLPALADFAHRTRYTYATYSGVATDRELLTTATHERYDGSSWLAEGSESYDYTDTSYTNASASNPYYASARPIWGLGNAPLHLLYTMHDVCILKGTSDSIKPALDAFAFFVVVGKRALLVWVGIE